MTTPVYLQGLDDLYAVGYNQTYDYGQAIFGIVIPMPRVANGPHIPTLSWIACRDGLQGTQNDILGNGFYFTHLANASLNSANFLLRVEEMLNISPVSVYKSTNIHNVTWIRPAPWWLSSWIRKSFLSLMLRCAFRYNMQNFNEALYSIEYTRQTKPAVEKFLKGFTVYDYNPSGTGDGWFNQFSLAIGNRNPPQYDARGNMEHIRRMRPSNELISPRAYQTWLAKGGKYGDENSAREDWYNAEAELLREVS